jgi:hypothetical protein
LFRCAHEPPILARPRLQTLRGSLSIILAGRGRWISEHIPAPASWSSPARITFRGLATPTRCSMRSRSSSPGIRRGAEPDPVLATVLFTDIVGATATAAAVGDRAWVGPAPGPPRPGPPRARPPPREDAPACRAGGGEDGPGGSRAAEESPKSAPSCTDPCLDANPSSYRARRFHVASLSVSQSLSQS